jgi:hypothetical protein
MAVLTLKRKSWLCPSDSNADLKWSVMPWMPGWWHGIGKCGRLLGKNPEFSSEFQGEIWTRNCMLLIWGFHPMEAPWQHVHSEFFHSFIHVWGFKHWCHEPGHEAHPPGVRYLPWSGCTFRSLSSDEVFFGLRIGMSSSWIRPFSPELFGFLPSYLGCPSPAHLGFNFF